MSANQHMALRVVWGTRLDDDTPAADARELLAMLGLIEPDGHEILPDRTSAGRLLNEHGQPVATAPPVAHPKPITPRKKSMGRKPIPTEHGTEHGYLQHKRKNEPIPADDSCGCQAAHDVLLVRRPRRLDPHLSSSVLPPEQAKPTPQPPVLTVVPDLQPLHEVTPLPAVALYPVDVDDWLADSQRSQVPAVRRRAAAAVVALMQLRCALDDLARAERGVRP